MTLEEWAAKARDELSHHCFIDDGTGEEVNNDDVLSLCEEYDKLLNEQQAIPMMIEHGRSVKIPETFDFVKPLTDEQLRKIIRNDYRR